MRCRSRGGIVSNKKGSRYVGGETDLRVKTKAWEGDVFDVAGVKRRDDGLPYALFTREGEYVGAAQRSKQREEALCGRARHCGDGERSSPLG